MNRFAWLAIAVFAVVALWCGGWFFGASFLKGQIESRAGAEPAISCATLGIGGFPFRYDITCTGAQMIDADTTVAVSEVRASARVYSPTFVEMFAQGPATMTDAFTGAAYRLDWQSLQASVRLDWTALARASVVAEGLVLADTVLDVTEIARIRHAEFHAVGVDGALGENNRNVRLYLSVVDAEHTRLEAPLQAEANVLVTEWPADVRVWGNRQSLIDWAAGEGALTLEDVSVETGELSAGLAGTLAPDMAGLVDGRLELTSRGFGPLLREYMAAPLAGALLGTEDETGTARQTLSISRSILRAGIVPLIQLPPLF